MDIRQEVHEPHSSLSKLLTEYAGRLELLRILHCEDMEAAAEFEERMLLAKQQWEIERKALMDQIAGLRNIIDQRELTTETAKTEAASSECRQGIEAMLDKPSAGVSKLIRETAREAELQAYLKGLKFSQSSSAGIPEFAGEEANESVRPCSSTLNSFSNSETCA